MEVYAFTSTFTTAETFPAVAVRLATPIPVAVIVECLSSSGSETTVNTSSLSLS